MAKEIPWDLTQALARLNAIEVVKKIDSGEYDEEKRLYETFSTIHHDLYEGTRNEAPEDNLKSLRLKNDNENAFHKLHGALFGGTGKPKTDGKEAEALTSFYQKALDPESLAYDNETQLTTEAFLYFMAKAAGHDLDFRRADAQDIAVLREPMAHSSEEVAETFKHLLDRTRKIDASLIRDGEVPATWKMPEGRHDPRLPEEPRLLYVMVDVDDPKSFEHLQSTVIDPDTGMRTSVTMTPELLKKEFAERFDIREDNEREWILHQVQFVVTTEGGLVWYPDFRADLEEHLTLNHKLPDRYKDEDGVLDIRKVEGQFFEIPSAMVIGRLDNVHTENPQKKLLTNGEDREPTAYDYLDAPFTVAERPGYETVYNNRRDLLSGHNLDLNTDLSAADEQRRAFNLGVRDEDGKLLQEGYIHQQAHRLIDAMLQAAEEGTPLIDRDELRDLFHTYRLATHPRVGEHFTDYRTIHEFGTELFKAMAEVVVEKYKDVPDEEKGVFESTFGMSGVGKSSLIEGLQHEIDMSLIRAGSNPDMKLVEYMHDHGFPTRLDGVMADIEECLDRALDRYKVKGRMTAPELSVPIGISAMRRTPGYLQNEKVDTVALWDSGSRTEPKKLMAESTLIGPNEFEHFSAKTKEGQGYAEGDEVHVLKLRELEDGRIKVLKVYGDKAVEQLTDYLKDGRRSLDEVGNANYRDFDTPQLPIDTGLAPERNIEIHYEKTRAVLEIG